MPISCRFFRISAFIIACSSCYRSYDIRETYILEGVRMCHNCLLLIYSKKISLGELTDEDDD